jgi:carbon monoxide dehydrogenase subunit G
MELTGERLIPANQAATWAALNDPAILQACIAGCESLERSGDDAFAAVVAVRIGPVSARFKGSLKMVEARAPDGCTIQFEGQGGAAGFGKGAAEVALVPAEGGTLLRYAAKAQVGGKLAQIGSRLVDAAAAKLAGDFFAAFEARLAPPAPPAVPEAPAGEDSALPTEPGASAMPSVSRTSRQAKSIGLALAAAIVAYIVFEIVK